MIKLFKKNDQVYAEMDGRAAEPVRIVYLRPISGLEQDISIIGEKEELACLKGLDELDPASREIAREELAKAYFLPRITRIVKTETHFGCRYFDVETNQGPARFLFKNPYVSVRWITEDEVLIVDAMGNRFHIPSVKAIDPRSRSELMKVL
jgi:hypothetical protein